MGNEINQRSQYCSLGSNTKCNAPVRTPRHKAKIHTKTCKKNSNVLLEIETNLVSFSKTINLMFHNYIHYYARVENNILNKLCLL